MSTEMCPMWPAFPEMPACRLPLRISPPPTPVETTMQSALSTPLAAPVQCSAAVIATASPTSTGLTPTGMRGWERTFSTSG